MMKIHTSWPVVAGYAFLAMITASACSSACGSDVDYLTQIKPILAIKCYSCHGALKQQSGLRLETRDLMLDGGDGGQVIVPGNSRNSRLIERLTADAQERMPPADEAPALTADEISLIRTWIDQGANAPTESIPEDPRDHWAFRPLVRPQVPDVVNSPWVSNPLDAFIAEQHQRYNLTPQDAAPRLIQLRRLYLALIGLPPTAAEIDAAKSDDSRGWYERAVDRLLDDPRHSERWARHWMDVWRYSDWWGYAGQLRYSQKHIWHWRDWIVESLNADTPYDEMLQLMLAADELHPNDLDKLRATGYLARNYFLFNRNQWLDEVVEHTSKGFLGLTMNCAKCHDHKYDPIAQKDYYAMRAFFEPYHVRVDVVPGEPDLAVNGIPRAFDGPVDVPTYLFVGGRENSPDKSSAIAPGVPNQLSFEELAVKPVPLPLDAWQPERRSWVIDDHLAAARQHVGSAETGLSAVREKQNQAAAEQASTPPEAVAELKVAELTLAVARAAASSVELRADAIRASWGRIDGPAAKAGAGAVGREKTEAAVGAERMVAVAQVRRSVAQAELELLRAAPDQRPSIEAKLNTARQSLAQAQRLADEPIKPSDQFARFVGAKWTPTRFFSSTKDDPTVNTAPQSSGRRTALARWITDPRNPLTARVAANHIWTRHMGAPLAPRVFDFGRNGPAPSHPELLDWLACELVDSGWSMRHLHRVIVNSTTYRMTSSIAGGKNQASHDPDNLRWWRRTPIRLESQVIRDSILAHAGTLDLSRGGPPVPPKEQAHSNRRSLYFFHSNDDRNQFLAVFDEATVKECYQRDQSIVPQQALALTNSGLVLDASQRITERLLDDCDADNDADQDRAFIGRAFSVLLGITANDAEIASSLKALAQWRSLPAENNARARLVWALLNHNDFVTLR